MLHKDNCKPSREAFEFLELVHLMLDISRYIACWMYVCVSALLTITGHRNELLLRGGVDITMVYAALQHL